MPGKRTFSVAKRTTSRSSSFKRAKTLPYASRVPRIPRAVGNGPLFDPTPETIKVRLRYCRELTMTYNHTSTNVAYEAFIANSPTVIDSVGGEALAFNTYKALYNKYRVLASHVEVTPINNQDKGILLVQKTPTTPAINHTLGMALEKKYTTWALPSQLRNGGKRSVTSYWSMKENPELAVTEFTDITTGPADPIYFQVGYGSYQTDQIVCVVNITYDVEFVDRKMVP